MHLFQANRERTSGAELCCAPSDFGRQLRPGRDCGTVDRQEGATRGAAEGVHVAREETPPRAGLAPDQEGYPPELRVEGTQEVREFKVGEPARKPRCEAVPGTPLRKRIGTPALACRGEEPAQGARLGR